MKNLVAKLLIVRSVALVGVNAAIYLCVLGAVALNHRKNLTIKNHEKTI